MNNGRKNRRKLLFYITAVLLLAVTAVTLPSCEKDPPIMPGVITDTGTEGETTEAPEPEITEYIPEMDSDADTLDGIAIKSAEDLAKIGVDPDYPLNGDYVLVIDIDLSELDGWTPIGNSTESGAYSGNGVFSGTFDGRNHVISGLTIEETTSTNSFWGLFGTVGNHKKNDPAVIKNIVMTNVKITLSSSATTTVGSLAGQVNGFAEISSVSLLSGSVEFTGSNSLGVGGMIGQCRTNKSGNVSNNGITIDSVFSNLTVDSQNAGVDYCGGIIGRIRDSALGSMTNVVLLGKATFEGNVAYAMAAGDYTANNTKSLYFLQKMGKTRDNFGESLSDEKLTDGTLSMSGLWTVSSGFYPMLSDVMDSEWFSIMDLAMIRFYQNETQDAVKNNFTLPNNVAGIKIKWESSDPSVIEIAGGTAKVTQPADGFVEVYLKATSGGFEKTYKIKVVTAKTGYFITQYVEAGKPIELGGYGEGLEFKWIIKDSVTGTSRIEKTDVPSFTPTEDDCESLITVQAEGYDDISIYYSKLPVVYLTGEKKYSAIPQGSYIDVEMKITASAEYADYLYDGDIEIRVRGNSTARLEKKPFKIKLETKANLLGIDEEGANKHWCLMANALDPTLMRNKIIQDFSGAIGTDVYMASENVVLIYNNTYYGIYQLTEHVRVDETRVDVFDWEEYAEEAGQSIAEQKRLAGEIGYAEESKLADGIYESMMNDWSWMETGQTTFDGVTYVFTEWGLPELPEQTGGFLLEMDFYSQNDGSLMRTETAYKQPLYFNTPEPIGYGFDSFMETDLYTYTYKYIQSFEYAIHSDDFVYRNSDVHYIANVHSRYNVTYSEVKYNDDINDGLHYSEMFDMDSLVNNFIFCEFIMNWDSMKNSFFVYKDVDDLAYIGPQWDFDWAFGNVLWNGNTWRPTQWHCRSRDFMVEQYYQEEQWNCLLIRDPYFLVKVWERWGEVRPNQIEDLVKDGGIIDSYTKYLRPAALANDTKWSRIAYGSTFDSETVRMNEFIDTRLDWLDKQFVSVEKLIDSLGVYHASDKLSVDDVKVLSNETRITVEVEDEGIDYVMIQVNGTTMVEAKVSGGKATATVDSDAIDADGYNCVTVFAMDSAGEYIIDEEHSDRGNYNCVVSNYYYFKIG